MKRVLIDSNILLDIFTEDPLWFSWSSEQLAELSEHNTLCINPIIYGEISVRFKTSEELDKSLPSEILRVSLPWEAAFLAGKSFIQYKKKGGTKASTLPDFFIGAHALTENLILLTRDASRYKTYYPKVRMVSPE